MNTKYYVGCKHCQRVKYMMVFPVVSLVHHLNVQAVALLLHGHLFLHALDPSLTITQSGLKAPNPLLDLAALSHQAGLVKEVQEGDASKRGVVRSYL